MANKLPNVLELERCPWCGINLPNLTRISEEWTLTDHAGINSMNWACYKCAKCGRLTLAYRRDVDLPKVYSTIPAFKSVDKEIPERARNDLQQAIGSMHAPSGAIMLCASSVDWMLKDHSYRDGSLYDRIDQAVENGLLTEGCSTSAKVAKVESLN